MGKFLFLAAILMAVYGSGCASSRPIAVNPASTEEQPETSPISPSAAYFDRVQRAIYSRWKELPGLTAGKYAKGEVIVNFRLHKDGTVTHVEVVHNTTDELAGVACQQAIAGLDSLGPWPPGFASPHARNFREISWRFRFEQ